MYTFLTLFLIKSFAFLKKKKNSLTLIAIKNFHTIPDFLIFSGFGIWW